MKKIFTLISAMVLSLSAMATTFTFTSAGSVKQTAGGYTVELSKATGNNDPFYSDKGEMRLYASNTITISGSENITSVRLTFTKQGSKDYATLTASTGNLVSGGTSTSNTDVKTDTWTGSAKEVTFTLGDKGQRIITQVVVNGDGSEEDPSGPTGPTEPDTPNPPTTLDPNFQYPEPTLLVSPATGVQGAPYTFIYNNIEVSCDQGAVTDKYFSDYAGYDITFTAAKPMKGIVINGFVKKGFEASVNHGNVSYLTPDADEEANPVVVITDINSTSVTLSCVKQLRCYNVEIYFEENPEATIGGGSTGSGNAIQLKFDTAEAVYEKEFSEMYGETNYSIFLYNMDDYDPYFALDIYPAAVGQLAGTYSWDDYTLGDYTYYVYGLGEYDMTWVEDGQVTIKKQGDEYTVTGEFLCDNGKTYAIYFEGEMPIYTDDEYYEDPDDPDSAVESMIEETLDPDAPAYDVLGRRVGKNYRGIYIRNGRKYVGM